MASSFDASEFVDDDFESARKHATAGANPLTSAGASPEGKRAPTREEVDARVTEMQQRLGELRRQQQELERERAALEDVRRRQLEFTTGRQEVVQQLTRGVGLLEEVELAARRQAEQAAKTLVSFREALTKVQAIHEDTWTKDHLNVELTRALTTVENARMEWNAARLKFEVLHGTATPDKAPACAPGTPLEAVLKERSYAELCKTALALSWPIVLVALAIFVVLLVR
jgi:DNA repair exonuclease SbcCD ATPase subunit